MAEVAPGIITFGLGGDHNAMIAGSIFTLGPITVEIVYPTVPGGGGGGFPGPAWNKVDNITKFYSPVEQQYYQPAGKKLTVSIKVTYKDSSIEKIFLVTPKRHDIMISVLSMLNVTVSRISIAVRNIKSRSSNIFAKITNFRNKDEK